MKKVLPLVILAFTLSLASCEKEEEVLPIEVEVAGVDQSIDYMAPTKPRRPTQGVDQSIDYMAPTKPRKPQQGVDQSIDYMAPTKPRKPQQ